MRWSAVVMLFLAAAPAAAVAQARSTAQPAPTYGPVIGRTTSTRRLTFGITGASRIAPPASGNTCASSLDARTSIARGANPIGPVGGSQTNTVVAIPLGGGNAAAAANRARNAEACGPAR